MKKIKQIGIDFGTSNTGICILFEDGSTKVFEGGSDLDGKSFPTDIYFLNRDTFYVGVEARNKSKENVGLGRHLRWIKRVLPEKIGLVRIFSIDYKISDLVAIILDHAKKQIEINYEIDWDSVVFKIGYPIVLGKNNNESNLAKNRLIDAIKKVGFLNYDLVPEPIAVAHYYANEIVEETNVLIFDCGGGTTDLSYINYKNKREFQVLGTAGVMKAGNDFDKQIFFSQIAKGLGKDLSYSFMNEQVTIPDTVYQKLGNPLESQQLSLYKYMKYVKNANSIGKRDEYLNLKYAIENQESTYLLGKAELLKIKLSWNDNAGTEISLNSNFSVNMTYNDLIQDTRFLRANFDTLITKFMEGKPAPDLVIMTGGMSQHRMIKNLIYNQFQKLDRDKIFSKNTDAIVRGLAVHHN